MIYKDLKAQNYIEAYSLQHENVIKEIENRTIYIPSLEKSAAYDPQFSEREQIRYRDAYAWMKEKFEHLKEYKPKDSLVWLFLSKEEIPLDRHQNRKISLIFLSIPKENVLIFSAAGYQHVLNKKKWCSQNLCFLPNVFGEPTESLKKDWGRIFKIADETSVIDLNAITDRIEPSWVKKIVEADKW